MNSTADHAKRASRQLRTGAGLLAALTFISGLWVSRTTDNHSKMTDEGWLMEEQQVLANTLEDLEEEWEIALTEAAQLESKAKPDAQSWAAREVIGVRQVSYFTPGKTDHKIVEFPAKERTPPRPAFEKNGGDFQISRLTIFATDKGQWIDEEGKPPLFSLSTSTDHAVILTLAPEDTAALAEKVLQQALEKLPRAIPPGSLRQIISPTQSTIIENGQTRRATEAADEVHRQFSRFGTWTIRYWRPRVQIVSYDLGFLLGSSILSFSLLAGGWWAARTQEQALHQAEQRVSFVNAVSHELRTPLTNILLSSEMVEEELGDSRSKKRIKVIKNEAHRLSRMVENVLTFARSERTQASPSLKETIELKSFFDSCIDPFRPSFERKRITCIVDITGSSTVIFCEDEVSQIIFNLLSNIQKYATDSTRVWIQVNCADECVIKVGNSSPSIPAESRERIFQPFERLDNDVANGTTGTGLGLSISRDLARNLGGELTLLPSSTETVFQLTLPQ